MIFILQILLFHLLSVTADPEPKAKKLLDKVYAEYEKANTLDIQFTYQLSEADIAGLSKKGQLQAKGDKYILILEDMEIYSDGKVQYTFLKKNKEVQITEPDEKENKYHPKNIAAIYRSGTHVYTISKKLKKEKANIFQLDFTPVDKSDRIAKFSIYIAEQSHQIEKVEWTERKGNKIIVKFNKSTFNKNLPDSLFTLDTKSLKDVHIEDLR